MESLTVDAGGVSVRLDGLRGPVVPRVLRRYRRFRVADPPALTLELDFSDEGPQPLDHAPTVESLIGRRYFLRFGALEAEVDLASGRGRARLPPSEYIVDSLVRMCMTLLLVERDALLVHSSGVRFREGALVCFGPSGVGKTTVARSVARGDVFCDEMMVVRSDGRVRGTPFHGDLAVCAPGEASLEALVELRQGDEDRLEPLSLAAATQALLHSTLFFASDSALAERLLGLASLVCAGRTYRLTFKRGTHVPSFVDAALEPASDPTAAAHRAAARAGARW